MIVVAGVGVVTAVPPVGTGAAIVVVGATVVVGAGGTGVGAVVVIMGAVGAGSVRGV